MQKKCLDPKHQRIPYCFNCGINGDCTNIKGHNQHCIAFDCDACALEDNLDKICTELSKNIGLYYTLNKFFILLHCLKIFGQPNKERYDAGYYYLSFTSSGVRFCQCW